MSNGYRIFSGLTGSKLITCGKDPAIFNYTDVEDAVSAMKPNDTLLIEDGTYTITSELTLNKNATLIGLGNVTITGALSDRLVMVNKPAAGTAQTTIKVSNIQFTNTTASGDAIEIDNDGGATGNLVTVWNECGFTTNAGLAFDIDQTTNTIDVFHYINGARHLPLDDDCNFALTKAGSEIHVSGYKLDGGETFILGSADVASVYFLNDIIFSSSALTSGGASSIIVNAMNCAKIASGALGAVALTDFDATAASENLQANALAA